MNVAEPGPADTAVVLPGTGSDEVFVRSVFEVPFAAVCVRTITPKPVPGTMLAESYLAALDEAAWTARSWPAGCRSGRILPPSGRSLALTGVLVSLSHCLGGTARLEKLPGRCRLGSPLRSRVRVGLTGRWRLPPMGRLRGSRLS